MTWFHEMWPIWKKDFMEKKEMARQRWHALMGIDRIYVMALLFLAGFVLLQFFWIIALQVQVSNLSAQAEIQEIRINQLEQSVKKHNEVLYSTSSTIWDIQEKWSDLNFRVMQNTWKLDK